MEIEQYLEMNVIDLTSHQSSCRGEALKGTHYEYMEENSERLGSIHDDSDDWSDDEDATHSSSCDAWKGCFSAAIFSVNAYRICQNMSRHSFSFTLILGLLLFGTHFLVILYLMCRRAICEIIEVFCLLCKLGMLADISNFAFWLFLQWVIGYLC